MKKKIKTIQIIRMIIQLAFLIILPGLFIQVFGEMKMVVTSLIDGSFNFMEMLPMTIEMLLVTLLTFIFGRFFCGWICAFGTYNDLVYALSSKIFKKKIRPNEIDDRIMKFVKYALLASIIILVWFLGFKVDPGVSPWEAFARIKEFPAVYMSMIIGFVVLGIITIGAAFIERFFCRYLCPLGGFLSIISRVRVFNILKPREKCGQCRACTNSCAMGIDLYKSDIVKSGECIQCMKCLDSCPRMNTRVGLVGEEVKPELTVAAALIGFLGFYGAGNVYASTVNNNLDAQAAVETTVIANQNNSSDLTNSVSTASPTSTPSATPTKSADATKKSANSTKIAKAASTKSVGSVKKSVTKKPVVKKAIVTKTTKPTKPAISYTFNNGTFTGSAAGFRGTTSVSVTIKNDQITAINILSYKDDAQFFNRAKKAVISRILGSQSTNVSAVSGATYSSNGIMDAVQNALLKAKI